MDVDVDGDGDVNVAVDGGRSLTATSPSTSTSTTTSALACTPALTRTRGMTRVLRAAVVLATSTLVVCGVKGPPRPPLAETVADAGPADGGAP